MNIIIITLLAAVLLALLFLLFKKDPVDHHTSGMLELKENEHRKTLRYYQEEKQKLEDEITDLRQGFMAERGRAVKAEEMLSAQLNKQQEQQQYIAELQQKFKLEFEQVASRILEEKTIRFNAHNQASMDLILSPLKQNIKAFEEKVDKVYKAESDERNILKGVISQLMEQSKQIQEDATNLTRALKGDQKKQGNWGEVILERVLERSGLVRDQEYRIQASFLTTAGNRVQPDVIIDLPDEKHIVVDAKVSLLAYEKYSSAETEQEKEIFLRQHLQSLRNHIQELSAKNYQTLYQINSPDFVLLFLPIESSFGLAVQKDAELFGYAWDRKVVIVSPTTLLATLRTISSIWKQERQNRNVLEIARLSGSLYDKFVGFLSDMDSIGRNIRQSHEAYDKAMNKLSTGAGNLANTADKIKKLGAKTTKQIDRKFLDPALNEEDIN